MSKEEIICKAEEQAVNYFKGTEAEDTAIENIKKLIKEYKGVKKC